MNSVNPVWLAAALVTLGSSLSATASDGQQRAVSAGASIVGTAAPALRLTTIDGSPIDLGKLYGKRPVYLKFWATWCVPCREQMPHFERTYEQRGKDLAVIAINAGFNDTVEDIRAYREQMGLKMPIVLDDGQVAAALHLRVTPQHIVIGRDGNIVYVGHLVDDKLEAALASAIAEHPGRASARMSSATDQNARQAERNVGEIKIQTTAGASLRLGDPEGIRSTVLAFISPWCESYLAERRPQRSRACKEAREDLQTLTAAGSGQRVIGISSGLWADSDDLAEYVQKYRIPIPVTLDESGALFRTLDVKDVPTFIVLDPKGHVLSRSTRLPPS